MKYHSIILIIIMAVMLSGCRKDENETTVEIKKDGTITLSIPENAPAKDLIQARGVIDNSMTLTAEQQEQAFTVAKMRIESEERKFNTGVVSTAIVLLSAIACVFIVWKSGGQTK